MAKAKKKAAKKTKKTTKKATKKTTSLSMGSRVPTFQLEANGGKVFNLADYKGQKLVIFFYPKDMTPGCTVEAGDFSSLKKSFLDLNARVFGVSRDSVKSHEKFIQKESYTVDLLSDEDEVACNIFDVIKDKNMYGRMVKGIERSTFVIDEKGKLVAEWRKVKVPGHAQAVLDHVKGL